MGQIWMEIAGLSGSHLGNQQKRFNGLTAMVQALETNSFCGQVFVFRGRRGDTLKVLWFDDQGLLLLAKCLERGQFVLPQAQGGKVSFTQAQLSMLLEGIDWRMPMRTDQPALAAWTALKDVF